MGNVVVIIITAFVALIVGYILRFSYAKLNAKSIEQISERIIKEAKLIAETKSKETLLEAKLIVDKERKYFEQEIREKKQFIQSTENRLDQREENLDRKIDAIDKKEKGLTVKEKSLSSKEQSLSQNFWKLIK